MTRRVWALAVALALVGCRGGVPANDAATPTWTLVDMRVGDEVETLVQGSTITISLGPEHRVHGSAGVNRYSGRIMTTDDGRYVWDGEIVTTKMAGPPDLMEQERTYLDALDRTDMMILGKDGLVLEGEDGDVRLVFR